MSIEMTKRNERADLPHSAGPHSGETEVGEPNASARTRTCARAHEGNPDSAQSQPESAVTFGDWARDVGALFTPPDIVRKDRPSLQKAWAYASRGEWTSRAGVYRRAGQAYGVFALVFKTLAYYADWVVERPTRLAAATAVVLLLAQFPPLSWLI